MHPTHFGYIYRLFFACAICADKSETHERTMLCTMFTRRVYLDDFTFLFRPPKDSTGVVLNVFFFFFKADIDVDT